MGGFEIKREGFLYLSVLQSEEGVDFNLVQNTREEYFRQRELHVQRPSVASESRQRRKRRLPVLCGETGDRQGSCDQDRRIHQFLEPRLNKFGTQ